MFVPDNKSKDTDVKSQMQNIKEEREFMRKLESRLGTKKGLPKLMGEHVLKLIFARNFALLLCYQKCLMSF